MSAYLSAVQADNPVHYWRCSDPGGSLLLDIGSSPRALEIGTGRGAAPAIGPISDGGAAWFGNGQAAQYRDQDLTLTHPFSMEIWGWFIFVAGVAQSLFAVATTAGGFIFEIGADATGKGHAFTSGGTITGSSVMTIQRWHHLVLTETVSTATLYVDGVNVGTSSVASFSAGFSFQLGGGGAIASPARLANCMLAEAALYSTALSSARVSAHFAAADQANSYPSSAAGGSFNPGTGQGTVESTQVTQIEADLVSVYQNAP